MLGAFKFGIVASLKTERNMRMKRSSIVLMAGAVLLCGLCCIGARAQDAAAGGAPGAAVEGHKGMPAPTDMTVTGIITKEDVTGKSGKTFSHYVLTDAAGKKVTLPGGEGRGRGGKHGDAAVAAAPKINLEEYVGKSVTVVGKGFERQKDGVTTTRIVEITKIDQAAAAAPAPAAPAPVAPVAK